jgi:hypothetical protein
MQGLQLRHYRDPSLKKLLLWHSVTDPTVGSHSLPTTRKLNRNNGFALQAETSKGELQQAGAKSRYHTILFVTSDRMLQLHLPYLHCRIGMLMRGCLI